MFKRFQDGWEDVDVKKIGTRLEGADRARLPKQFQRMKYSHGQCKEVYSEGDISKYG